jgi:hypothetical protein
MNNLILEMCVFPDGLWALWKKKVCALFLGIVLSSLCSQKALHKCVRRRENTHFRNSPLTQLQGRCLAIFYGKSFDCTGDHISTPCKWSLLYPGSQESWSWSRVYSLCMSPLSLIPALNELIWDGGIHQRGFRSPTAALLSQLRQELTDREKTHRTHRWLGIFLAV